MTKIIRSSDCGNSPKNKAIEEMAIALERGGLDGAAIAKDVAWSRDDGSLVEGCEAVADAAARVKVPAAITIRRVSSHGKVAAVSGQTDRTSFAHVFEFTSVTAKQLRRIDSFRKVER